jgi:hypothetical protein
VALQDAHMQLLTEMTNVGTHIVARRSQRVDANIDGTIYCELGSSSFAGLRALKRHACAGTACAATESVFRPLAAFVEHIGRKHSGGPSLPRGVQCWQGPTTYTTRAHSMKCGAHLLPVAVVLCVLLPECCA